MVRGGGAPVGRQCPVASGHRRSRGASARRPGGSPPQRLTAPSRGANNHGGQILWAFLSRLLATPGVIMRDEDEVERDGGYRSRLRAVTEDQRLVCRWRPDGTLTFVSDAYCRYFGLSVEQLIGRSLLTFVAEADRDRVREH